MLDGECESVGLPNRSSERDGGGRFVPSRIALESGIGTVPSSPNSPGFEFPPNTQRPRGPAGGRSRRGGRGRGRRSDNAVGGGEGKRNGKGRRPAQPVSP
mmetsp:Transcript_10337/g.22372  ORF Transcript_10337/g.22372 Transcript_10337/m.22372 type:complete len:100 (-) Transcript_10337:58-357(-)